MQLNHTLRFFFIQLALLMNYRNAPSAESQLKGKSKLTKFSNNNRLLSISKVAMLILYERMFFLSNIMFIFFVCFICFFICHPLLLWQKISRSKMAYPYHSAPAYLALRIALVRAIILLYSITTFLPLCLIMMHLQFSP